MRDVEEEAPPFFELVFAAAPAGASLFSLFFLVRAFGRAFAAAAEELVLGRFLLVPPALLLPLLLLGPVFFRFWVGLVFAFGFFAFLGRGGEQSCRSTHAPIVVRPGRVSCVSCRTGNLNTYQ